MTAGNPVPILFRFALPLMVGNMFQQMYTVVDTAVVGKALGVEALAALGATDWITWLLLGMVQGLSQGFGILMAQRFGAGRMAGLRKVVGTSLTLSAVGALVLLAVGQLLAKPMLVLLDTPAQIMPNSLLYLRVMFLGIPIVMAYNLLATILRSMGDGKTPLYAMIVASVTNIALDLLFVLVFRWGIAGAVSATLVAQIVSSAYCFVRILKMEDLRLSKEDMAFDGELARRLMVLGSPTAMQNCIIAVGGLIVQTVVNGSGVVFIAGFTATNKLHGLLDIAAISYGYAMATYAGQNLGAGKIGRIRQGIRTANTIGMFTSAAIGGIMILFGKHILGLFLSGDPQEVAQAMDVAYVYLCIMSVSLPLLYYLHVTRSTVQGMGNTLLPMVSGVLEFFMRTGTALLAPMLMGEFGIFFAETMAWMGADVVLTASYFLTIKRAQRQNDP